MNATPEFANNGFVTNPTAPAAPTQGGLLNDRKVSVWRAILSAVCYFIFYFGLRLIVEVGYTIYLYATLPLEGLSDAAIEEMINQAYFDDGNWLMIVADILIFLVLAIIFLARGKTFAEGMGMKKTKVSSVLLAFLAGLGLTCALGFVMIFVELLFPGLMKDYNDTMDASYNMNTLIPYILAGVIGAPLIEELIFRHLVTGRLSRGIPRIVAILIGSALFGIIHGHPLQWAYAAVLGFVMSCVYFSYDSIWVPIAMHAGFNSLSVLAYFQAMEMTESQEILFGVVLFLVEIALALFGLIALVVLLIRRPHSIFKKTPLPAAPALSAFDVMYQTPASIYREFPSTTASGAIPTVAEMTIPAPTAAAPQNAETAAPAPANFGAIPTVAELTKTVPAAAEAPAAATPAPAEQIETTLPVEPIQPVEPIRAEATPLSDETGGQQ